MDLADHVRSLHTEARRANERRLLVIQGEHHEIEPRLSDLQAGIDDEMDEWVCLGNIEGSWSTIARAHASRLLGRTIPGVLIDARDSLRPNVIGQSVGAVEGGGLIVLLIGPPQQWLHEPLESDRRLAVPPYTPSEVSTRFRGRFYETLEQHRGVSIYDATADELLSDGRIGPATPDEYCPAEFGEDDRLDLQLRAACVTDDQQRCVQALRGLTGTDIVVVESHRGRGKSAAAGIAAAGFADDGAAVIVTGPGRDAVREVFERAATVLETVVDTSDSTMAVHAPTGTGEIRFVRPHTIGDEIGDADVLIVDEAAALPVNRLRSTLDASLPVAYLTTTHGYEGTGRGFSVRFNEHIEGSGRPTTRLNLREPIRYAMGDPIETWQFRALLLDASPPPAPAVTDAEPSTVEYAVIDRASLLEDEALLRELFGLLVVAHYRTEPDDLFRLLDAPNISIRALLYDGHPVSVAMLAAEGGLDETWCDRLYAGESIRGHMIPDLLTTQLRDRKAGTLRGLRVLRIATHEAVRSRGLGSMLLSEIYEEFESVYDWFGAGFGATPKLLSFWSEAGYRQIHLGTRPNPRSGEHSAVMLRAGSSAGSSVIDRHEQRLVDRLPGQLPDTLRDIDPALVVATARAIDVTIEVDIRPWMWDVVEAAATGPGQVATAPEAFSKLALAGLSAGCDERLTETQRFLLVRRAMQATSLWVAADELGMHLGDARNELRAAIETLRSWYIEESE